MAYGESNSHVTNDVAWPQRSYSWSHDALRAQYLENSWRCYLDSWREAIWSAILATAWLLVTARCVF